MNTEQAKAIIENEKQQQTALAKITSTSKAGVWVQLKFVYAVVAEWIFSQWEAFRVELETLVNTRRWATTAWYIEKAKEFQLGDMLELLDNGQFGYKVIKPDTQIIKQAAIEVVDRELRFKVATESGGELDRVADADMSLFKSYINQIKRPGTPIRFINYEADLLRLSFRVYFDGELLESEIREAITIRVKNYLKEIVFNGVFSITKLIDEIQQVAGITECVWLGGESWSATLDQSGATAITDRHRAQSGYFKLAKDENDIELLNLELIRDV